MRGVAWLEPPSSAEVPIRLIGVVILGASLFLHCVPSRRNRPFAKIGDALVEIGC
jgi:hypothetical protein